MPTADNKKIAKNTLYMYIRMGVTILIGFYTSRVVLRTLGVSDYGIYNAVGGIVSLFIFLNTAMTQATQRFMSYELGKGNKENLNRTFSMCLNVHILIAALIVLLCEVVGLWLLYNKMIIPEGRMNTAFWVFQFSIFTCVMNITQVPYNATLYSHEKFNIVAGLQILQSLLNLGFVIALQYIPFDKLLVYAFNVMLVQTSIIMLNRTYDIRHFPECHYKLFWDKEMFKQIMGYSSWSLAGDLANTLANQGVNILSNMFFGPAVNASRGIATQVNTAVSSFVGNFQGASIPQIVKLYAQGEKEPMVKLVISSSKISFFLFYILVLPICLEMHMLLYIWLQQVPEYMVAFSRLSLLIVLTQSLGGTLLFVIQATGRIKRYQMMSSIFNLSIFPITYVLFKLGFNPTAPFILTILIKMVVDITIYINVRYLADFPIMRFFKEVLMKIIIIGLVGAIVPVAIFLNLEEGWPRLIVLFAVSFLVNMLLVFYVGFSKHEREWVLSLVLKRHRKQ